MDTSGPEGEEGMEGKRPFPPHFSASLHSPSHSSALCPLEVARQPGPAHTKRKEVPSPARQVFKGKQN